MRILIFNSDAEAVRRLWDEWVADKTAISKRDEDASDALAFARLHVSQVSAEQTLAVVRLPATASVKVLVLVSFAICAGVGEVLIRAVFPHIIGLRPPTSSRQPLDIIAMTNLPTTFWLAVIGFACILAVVLILPPFLLASPSVFARKYEQSFVNHAESSRMICKTVADSREYLFFPGDIAISLTYLAIFVGQIVGLLSTSIVLLLSPVALIGCAYLATYSLRQYAVARLSSAVSAYALWRVRAVDFAALVSSLFITPLFIYWLLTLNYRLYFLQEYLVPRATYSAVDYVNAVFFPGLRRPGYTEVVNGSVTIASNVWVTYIGNPPLVPTFWLVSVLVVIVLITLALRWSSAIRGWRVGFVDIPEIIMRLPQHTDHVSFLAQLVVALTWIIILPTNILGAIVSYIGLDDRYMACFAHYSCGSMNDIVAPVEWFRICLASAFGNRLGAIAAFTLFALLFLPCLLWIVLSIVSLVPSAISTIRIVLTSRRPLPAKEVVKAYCRRLGIPAPLVATDIALPGIADTTVILPFVRCCIIRINVAVLSQLSDNDLELIAAHELGHIITDRRKLWALHLLGRVSLVGPAFLTLMLDYWSMELDADRFALRLTESASDLAHLLIRSDELQDAANIAAIGARIRWWFRLVEALGLADLYSFLRFYFDASLWGAVHPSSEERVEALIANRASRLG